MTGPTPSTRVVRSVDLPLGGNRTLRVTLAEATDDHVAECILAAGFGGADTGDPFLRPHWAGLPLRLPASALPALRDALDALAGEAGP